jgi:hypothetical protein
VQTSNRLLHEFLTQNSKEENFMSTQKGLLQKLSNSIKQRPSEILSEVHVQDILAMNSFERTKKLEFDEVSLDRDEEIKESPKADPDI